jgi:periplasmic protein TonB
LVEEKIVKTTDQPPEQLNEPKVVEADEPSLPDGVKQSNVVEANEPPAQPKEPKVVTADEPPADHLEEQKVAKANKTVPIETIEDQKPKVAEVEVQPEQVAIMTEQNSGVAKTGGDARVVGLYLGKVNDRVQRSKVNPSSRETGIVVLKFTIGIDGSLLSKDVALSSGSLVLDIAALKTLIRAAPFPPIPAEVSLRPMVFTQVFKFVIR